MGNQTPMLQQYKRVKSDHPDKVVMFRLGDFYEMFFEDAEIASRELDITLTSRPTGKGGRIPMAGVPHHAVDAYLEKLVSKGYKVAICDQVEDASKAKGLVKRDVTRVITPGTCIAIGSSDGMSNYLVSLAVDGKTVGLAVADASTGEFQATEFQGHEAVERAREELLRLEPSECLVGPGLGNECSWSHFFSERLRTVVTLLEDSAYNRDEAYRSLTGHLGTLSLRGFGLEGAPMAVAAAGALLGYLRETHKTALEHVTRVTWYEPTEFMTLDLQTRRNLELVETLLERRKTGSLLWVLDSTVTSMGGRLLRKWTLAPLVDIPVINERLDAVDYLVNSGLLRAGVRDGLGAIRDLERLMARVSYGSAGPRDLVALKTSLRAIPPVARSLAGVAGRLGEVAAALPDLEALVSSIEGAIVDDPPVSPREGGFVRKGFSTEIDRLKELAQGGRHWMARFEAQERQRTQIRSLKVGFNRVFGYYIEVTQANLEQVPPEYVRRQTLANAERFVTSELKEQEEAILGSEERLQEMEYGVFSRLREEVLARAQDIQAVARVIAEIDCLACLAEVAAREGYARPLVEDSGLIEIRDGRHPVLERVLEPGEFVPNDCLMNTRDSCFLTITGPNMAGKSTYLRQVALIVLMAQMGGFVPARSARIGLVDRVFTRVGAWDDLAMGQSTFMVEMTEVANILHHATGKSLIILDEIGRGTSTYDGLSIAWAVSEHILDRGKIGARTLFATHYREMTALEARYDGVRNYSVAIRKKGGQMVFLRRLVQGGADGSYGIDVARLAGLPPEVIERARQILTELEASSKGVGAAIDKPEPYQVSFLEPQDHPAVEELRKMSVLEMTPIEALQELYRLQALAKRER